MLKPTIICVDDDQLILTALKEQLNRELNNEYYIETAESAEEAIEIFDELIEEKNDVPVVISDYLMPGIKGDEFLVKVHKISPETKKILLTGHARLEGVATAVNMAELYRYIEKPWDKEDLVLTVTEAVKSYFQSKQIREYNKKLENMNSDLEEKVRIRTRELREVNAMKDKFFSIIAHDLKNPFTALTGYSSMLINEFESFDDNEKIHLINSIYDAAENTLNLLNNLLEWAKAQQGLISVEKNLLSLKSLAVDSIGPYKASADTKHIKLINKVPDNINVNSDYFMLNTIIRNLVNNAIKFTPDGGEIKVDATTERNSVLITISDTGVGMDEEKAANLFRIDKNTSTKGTRNESGSGLGLILCKEFVAKIDGKIWVNSTQDSGTTFTVEIPAN